MKDVRIPELESISKIEQIFILHNMIMQMGRGWLRTKLKEFNIPKRTAIYKSYSWYQYPEGYWSWSDEQREQHTINLINTRYVHVAKILQHSKWSDWISAFVEWADFGSIKNLIHANTSLPEYSIIVKESKSEGHLAKLSDLCSDIRSALADARATDPDLEFEESSGTKTTKYSDDDWV